MYFYKNFYAMDSVSKSFFQNIWKKIKEIISLSEHVDVLLASESIKKNIVFRGPNAYILAFAVVIASVGLNVNSIPVIIGAMLISPLMGPIIGLGYGLGVNDTGLLKKAALNLLVMVIISILTSSLYFLLSPLELENPTELLARTNPTIFDVLIAIFGGFAGIIEISRKEKGTVFAGVAIATALMPPLCTVGFGIAGGEIKYILGALYLFFINSVFIALATFVTVKYLKFPTLQFADPVKQRKVNRWISIFTIILIAPSVYSAVIVVKENQLNQTARDFVSMNKTLTKSYIFDYSINYKAKPATIEVSIAGDALSDSDTELLYRSAENLGLKRDQIIIKQNLTSTEKDITDKAVVQSIFERNDQEIKKRELLIADMENELKSFKEKELPYKQMTREILAQYPSIISFSIARGAEVNPSTLATEEQIIIIIKSNVTISDSDLMKLRQWLSIRLDFSNLKIVQER